MSCVLRVWGDNFDVDACLEELDIEPINVWYKGQPKFKTQPNGKKSVTSGFTVELSGADFSEIDKQIEQSIEYCSRNKVVLGKLVSFSGVDGAVADFGADIYPPGWASFCFPPELSVLLGGLGISIGLSVYPTEDEEENET